MDADPLHQLAERRIQEALEAGAFDRLAGAGKPLELDDLSGVPEELRAGYLLLRSAGMLPEEMELKRSLVGLDDLIACCHDSAELRELRRRRDAAALRFAILMEKRGRGAALADYGSKIADRLAR